MNYDGLLQTKNGFLWVSLGTHPTSRAAHEYALIEYGSRYLCATRLSNLGEV